MKKCFLLCLAVALSATLFAQAKKEIIKTGWNIAPFPAVSFNTDLGLQYGIYSELFYYGNEYPNYEHKFTAEVSAWTKGSMTFRFFYDSKFLIPNTRFTMDCSYFPNKMLGFYGYNGYAAPMLDNEEGDFRISLTSPLGENTTDKSAFYFMKRDLFRFVANFQWPIADGFGIAAGLAYYNAATGRVEIDDYKDQVTLFDLYRTAGLIEDAEADGGNITQVKVGAVYDTRTAEGDPTRGIYAEAMLIAQPDWIDGDGYDNLQLSAVWRHYVPIVNEKYVFAYRVGYQGVLAGKMPYYFLSNLNTLYFRQMLSEGLGGTTSIRGVLRNRIVGNGMAWFNAEVRAHLFNFNWINQNFCFVVNPFFDGGMAVQPYRLDQMKYDITGLVYSGEKEGMHLSAGIGARIVMNRNFTLSAEFGKCFDSRDGNTGFNLYMNFLF